MVSSLTAKHAKKGTCWASACISSSWPKTWRCSTCFLASCFLFCMFLFLVLIQAPAAGKQSAVAVKAIPSSSPAPVSYLNSLQTVCVNCVPECFAWFLIQGYGLFAPEDCYVGSCYLVDEFIYIYIYISVHYMFFCKMVFTQDKEKKKSALNDRTRVPCFSCFFMFWTCFFLMFLLHSGKSRSWAERSNSSSRFLFFWCMITKPKNSFGNCVLQGQHWKGCFERWLSQGVVLDIWVFWNNLIFFDVIAKIQGAGWCLQVEVCFLSIGIELHVSPWFILNCCTSKEKKSLEAKHYNLTKDCVFARFVFFSKETLHVSSGPWDFEEPQWRPDQGFPLHFLCMIEWFYHFNLLQENTSLKDKMQKVPFFLGLCIILILVYLYI